MSKKQYVIETNGAGDNIVLLYVNDKLVSSEVVTAASLPAYIGSVENLGHRQAYCKEVCKWRAERAYEAFREAMAEYEKAQAYPLELSAKEMEVYLTMTDKMPAGIEARLNLLTYLNGGKMDAD